jgi:gliding motility-associated protein GldC
MVRKDGEDCSIRRQKRSCYRFGIVKAKESMRIDLWTKEMPVDEMKIFFHQTLVALSDTFHHAWRYEKMADTMKGCDYFAEKLR